MPYRIRDPLIQTPMIARNATKYDPVANKTEDCYQMWLHESLDGVTATTNSVPALSKFFGIVRSGLKPV